jgi:hypothetical protein
MKKFLFLILMLILVSCKMEKTITSENVKVYNIYGQKIIEMKTCYDVDNKKLNNGVYYIQYTDDNEQPYWAKVVKIDL